MQEITLQRRNIYLAEGTLFGHIPSRSNLSLISQANMLGLAFLYRSITAEMNKLTIG